ncbi:tripartite tricarboxylate transporter substrate binding protein [Verticiella sediminum]|uniref:Tripartite tricarboxylate transporter substrate binding protein n=1 Tax=Verticiella sediminum TaxID=1247510 RepID=A0A556AJK6_9BURK|nr:tripartite tricarboxylate transporter substrate binding protein [Verticiella sediminum]TSH93066.1 tripartite tricarboxylate transporter substrate binding protein [Verticiella sediminum]
MKFPIPWPRLVACATAIVLCSSAFAADYPSRPVKVVVPFGPGGAAQALAEKVGAEISKTLGQPLVHEYKGGAAGLVGAETAARAPADGHTVFMGVPSALIVAPLVMKSLTRFDPEGDFEPIAGIASTPFVVFVNARLPIGNLRELIDYGRQHPGKLNFGSIGSNGTDYIAGQVLQKEAGFQMTSVPYKSVGALLPDILSGRVDVAILSPIPIMAHVRAGDLRILAVTSGERSQSSALKDVPTVAEEGVPGYEIVSWYGYFAPKGTAPDQILSLNRATAAALGDEGVIAYLKEQGLQPFDLAPEQFADYYQADMKKWTQFVHEANIPVQ